MIRKLLFFAFLMCSTVVFSQTPAKTEVIGSLAGDFAAPTDHQTKAAMKSWLYENNQKTATQTGTWEFYSLNESTDEYRLMDSQKWFSTNQGGGACYSDAEHADYVYGGTLLFFADYANTDKKTAKYTVDNENDKRPGADYLFNHPNTGYASVIRWTPSADYNCFSADNRITFTGEILGGSESGNYIGFSIYGVDSAGNKTLLLQQGISHSAYTIGETVDKYDCYEFVLSPNGNISCDSNALKLNVLKNAVGFPPRYSRYSKTIPETKTRPLGRRTFEPLAAGVVEPAGWLRDWALDARNGYTACMDDIHIDFKHAWAADYAPFHQVNAWYQGAWHLEGGGYWFDGLVRLAYALHDEELIAQAKRRFEPVLENCNSNGIGHYYWLDRHKEADVHSVRPNHGWGLWANNLFGHALTAYAAASGDPRAFKAMRLADDSRDIDCLPLVGVGNVFSGAYNAYEDYRMTQAPETAEVLDRLFYEKNLKWTWQWETYRSRPPKELLNGEKLPLGSAFQRSATAVEIFHGAPVNEALMGWPMGYLWTGNREFLDVTTAWTEFLDEKCLQPHGALASDEWFANTGAYRGTETCTLANELFRRIQLFAITGNGPEADQMERLMFNAAAGSVTRDFTKHVYFQAPNRPHAGAVNLHCGSGSRGNNVYKRMHGPLCCTAGLNKLVPFYIQHLWMETPDNGLAAVMYAPNRITYKVGSNGGTVTKIESQTEYPFNDSITMTVRPEKPVAFPLSLRIPVWCKQPKATLNGQNVAVQKDDQGFMRLDRTWSDGDQIVLTFPMSPVVEHGIDKNPVCDPAPTLGVFPDSELLPKARKFMCVSYGPLLFAYPVAEKDENTPVENAPWQYALDKELTADQIEVVRKPMPDRWDWRLDAPVQLKVPAIASQWEHNPNLPALPQPADIQYGEKTTIPMVPYGCSKLHISIFPTKE